MTKYTRLSKGSRQRWTRCDVRALLCLSPPFLHWHAAHLPVSILCVFLSERSDFPAERPESRARVIHHAKKPSVMNSPSCSIRYTKNRYMTDSGVCSFLPETHFFPFLARSIFVLY